MGEPDIDRNSSPLLFFESIALHAGEGFDQSGFAVVDVAGRAYND
jgi:hypothetical protein